MTILEKPVTWSKSQVGAYRECHRKGYFSSSDDPMLLDGRVHELKKLKNRYLWTGAIVHDIVGSIIKSVRQGNAVDQVEDVIASARVRMRDEFKISHASESVSNRLFEHEYQEKISKETWQAQWASVEKSLRWFMGSSWLSRLSTLQPEHWKAVDEVLSFDVDGIKAYVKIDCAVEIEGRVILMDWKTSSLKADDARSLEIAALYAHEVWGADAGQISAHAVSLIDGRAQHVQLDEDVLMAAFMRIQEESLFLQEMKAVPANDPFSIQGCRNQTTCARCNFKKICFPDGV